MNKVIFFLIILMMSLPFAHAGEPYAGSNFQIARYNNITFTIPDCLELFIENGSNVYRFKNKEYAGYIMVTGAELSAQRIYDNLKQLGQKLTYLNKESIRINNLKVTLISFKSHLEEQTNYNTYIFDELHIKFITRETTAAQHPLFWNVVNSVSATD